MMLIGYGIIEDNIYHWYRFNLRIHKPCRLDMPYLIKMIYQIRWNMVNGHDNQGRWEDGKNFMDSIIIEIRKGFIKNKDIRQRIKEHPSQHDPATFTA
jgi:hypothetical protein